MRMLLILILFLSTLNGIEGGTEGGKVVPCFYLEEAEEFLRNASSGVTIEDMDVTYCSHVFYFSEQVDESIETLCSGGSVEDNKANAGQGSLQKLLDKKRSHRNLKIFNLVLVQEFTGYYNYSRKWAKDTMNLTSHLVSFLKRKGFDGLVEVWFSPFDNEMWSKTLRSELEEQQLSLMIILTNSNLTVSETKYDAFFVPNKCHNYNKYLLSQLESLNRDNSSVSTTENCIQEILDLGVDPSKILMPISFLAARLDMQWINRGDVSVEELKKIITVYDKVCTLVQNESWERLWDEKTGTYLLRKDKEVIMYESPRSIAEKINFVKQKQLGGVFGVIPQIDDFGGSCGQGKYPLLSTIGKELLAPTLLEPANGNNRASHPDKYTLLRIIAILVFILWYS